MIRKEESKRIKIEAGRAFAGLLAQVQDSAGLCFIRGNFDALLQDFDGKSLISETDHSEHRVDHNRKRFDL
ncbi:MAG: hypothetical protein ANABAC_2965 [Anaerolineae bacterium]|nr:MAG: hypothetical protein ANABAC_2965 [Anaerolineae bacterium]